MIEKALIAALVSVALAFGASRLGEELRHTFCNVAAAFEGGTCKETK